MCPQQTSASFGEVRGNGEHGEEAGEWSDVQADKRNKIPIEEKMKNEDKTSLHFHD